MKKLFKNLYSKIFKIDDSPQKIAAGFGLGIFTGIIPGIGPLAALFLAFIFHANRASALAGSLLTNTWISFLTFILAIRISSVILKINWEETHSKLSAFLSDFKWNNLFDASFFKIIFTTFIGYIVIALLAGIAGYIIVLIALEIRAYLKRRRQK